MTDDPDTDDGNPLNELLVDKNEVNQERLATVLSGLIGIDRESGELVIQSDFHNLDSRSQMVALLLAKRAGEVLGVIDEADILMNSSEIAEYVDVSSRSIRTYGSEKLSFVKTDQRKGGYFIPAASVSQAIQHLEQARSEN